MRHNQHKHVAWSQHCFLQVLPSGYIPLVQDEDYKVSAATYHIGAGLVVVDTYAKELNYVEKDGGQQILINFMSFARSYVRNPFQWFKYD